MDLESILSLFFNKIAMQNQESREYKLILVLLVGWCFTVSPFKLSNCSNTNYLFVNNYYLFNQFYFIKRLSKTLI